MDLPEKYFPLLDVLGTQKVTSQRQLSEQSGISLGHVNFLVKKLSEKGLIKMDSFRSNPRKIDYVYLLTPKGIAAKSHLALKFVMSKLREYDHLRDLLVHKLTLIEKDVPVRLIFVGPPMVKDFVSSIIEKRHLRLILLEHYNNWEDLKDIDPESFDVVLIFDGNLEGVEKICNRLNIMKEKLITFW